MAEVLLGALKIIGILTLESLADHRAREFIPLSRGSKGFKILVGAAIDRDRRGSNDSSQIQQGFLIDFVAAE